MNPPARHRILLLDDLQSQLSAYQMWLDLPAVELHTATGQKDANELIAQHQFDAAVIDIVLPDGDGHQVVQHLRQAQPSCAIVVVSSRIRTVEASWLLGVGADGYLTKSEANEERLRDAINTALEKKQREPLPAASAA